MKWAKSEYILKGVFLGLLLFVSLQNLDWAETGRLAVFLAGGLVAGLVIGAARQFRTLPGLLRNPAGYFLFLLLENPVLIYAGIILGLGAGTADYLYAQKLLLNGADAPMINDRKPPWKTVKRSDISNKKV